MQLRVRSQDGVREVAGKMESMGERAIMLFSRKNKTQESIALDDIVEARVKAPW